MYREKNVPHLTGTEGRRTVTKNERDGTTPTQEPREGDVYATVEVFGKHFELRYGYYDDRDRSGPADVIYPDFRREPLFTDTGEPFVTMMQDICDHYESDLPSTDDSTCADCKRFVRGEEFFGICSSPKTKRTAPSESYSEAISKHEKQTKK